MKTETKNKIIKEYLSERAKKGGDALKAKRGLSYYSELGKKSAKAKLKNLKLKTVEN